MAVNNPQFQINVRKNPGIMGSVLVIIQRYFFYFIGQNISLENGSFSPQFSPYRSFRVLLFLSF